MKTNVFATAAAALIATSMTVSAEQHMSPENLISADQIEDGAIYRLDVTADDPTWMSGDSYEINAEWNKVGTISDVLMDRNGQVVAILGEIGGFLDIGDRDVILPLENVRFATGEDKTYSYITNLTEEELNNLPEVDESIFD